MLLRSALLGTTLSILAACSSAGVDANRDAVETDERIEIPLASPIEDHPCRNEDADATAVRRALSRVRLGAGLPDLRCDDAIANAATAHCAYVAANGALTHVEEQGKPGFFGARFTDRMKRAGARETPASEVLANFPGDAAVDGADGWMNSVYHRGPLLRREVVSFGYGHAQNCGDVNLGKDASTDRGWTVWPPTGSRSVPTTFIASHESPNPAGTRAIVGSPISFVSSTKIRSLEATLRGPSGDVAVLVLTEANDAAGLVQSGEAHLIPLEPLEPLATYTATFSIVAAESIRATTTFTTGAHR